MTATTFLDLQIRELRIPFKASFRHASAERTETSSVWATARAAAATGYGESCPRPYVTGETIATAHAFCDSHAPSLLREVTSVSDLREWIRRRSDEIDANPAAWCALELALLDALAKDHDVTVEALLGLPPLSGEFRYSAVIGDSETSVFAAVAERYRRYGFTDFKIKLSGDLTRDRDKVRILHEWGLPALRLRADANNLWETADAAIQYLEALKGGLWAIEEPIAVNRYSDLARISDVLGCRIILDESCVRINQLPSLSVAPAQTWIINVRVSKMGGLLRSLDLVTAARSAGHAVIVGAQVGETSLLTRAGLTVARSGGSSLVAQEGAFGTQLLEYDMVDPPLMFGDGGVLDMASVPIHQRPGFGLSVREGGVISRRDREGVAARS